MRIATRPSQPPSDVGVRAPRIGVVGCGDVLYRSYLRGLATIADRVQVVAWCDRDRERATRARDASADLWAGALPYTDLEELLGHEGLEAVIDLTPAPEHFAVNEAALAAGVHLYSEKPLAGSVTQADALIAAAARGGQLLLSAPAVMATPRFRWLSHLIESGRIGRPTLATAQLANLGPAAWRVYTGDPEVYYSSAVGPLLDQGVYLLHAITGLLGPARRVQALGTIAIPTRTALAGARAGERIRVETNDHMLLQLECGDQALAQLVSSFAVPGSRVPTLELHGTAGSLSVEEADNRTDAPVDIFLADDSDLGLESWLRSVSPPGPPHPIKDLIGFGPTHFIACLRGEAPAILTAEHARHVLEIVARAHESVELGRAVRLETTFDRSS